MNNAWSWSNWIRQESLRWSFIAKTCAAAMLALFISFRLDLEAPGTALVTVFIVAQPQSGMVIAKGFYRLVGTAIGSIVTLLILAAFAQNPTLFLLAISLWIGICVACAAWFRDFQAYAFVLAGYTACLIGFPAVQNPDQAFDLAITRVSEIYIGILCTAVISDVFWPQHLTPQLVQNVQQHYHDLIAYLVRAVAQPLDISIQQEDPLRFVIRILDLESLRALAVFEDPRSRIRSDRLRLFSADFMRLTTTLQALEQMGHRMRNQKQWLALNALRPIVQSLGLEITLQGQIPQCAAESTPILRQLGSYQPWLVLHLQDTRLRLQAHHCLEQELDAFDDASALLTRMVSELYDLTGTYASLLDSRHKPKRPVPSPVFFTPSMEVIITGIRAVLAMLVLNVFWIKTAWPQGALAATIACIACALFASVAQPQRAVRHMAVGFSAGLMAAMLMNLMVLPYMHSFVELSLGIVPFIICGLWVASRPETYGMGTAFCMMLSTALPLQNTMVFDGVMLLNNGLAQLLGLAIAGIAFSVLQRGQIKQQRDYYVRHLARTLAATCRTPLKHLPHQFDGRIRDLMRQVMLRSPHLIHELLPCALSVLELGDAIIRLRLQPTSSIPALKKTLRQLELSLRQPSQLSRQQAMGLLRTLMHQTEATPQTSGEQTGAHIRRVLQIIADDPWFARFQSLDAHYAGQGVSRAT